MSINRLLARGLVGTYKPWLVPSIRWKDLSGDSTNVLNEIFRESGSAIAVAKPSENLYLATTGVQAILNLASHGEMAVSKLIIEDKEPCQRLTRLVNILPTRVEVNFSSKMGEKRGKFLNHFGYRKQVMNLVPESLTDHAWIASALSYSARVPDVLPERWMFDPQGGWIAEGVAAITKEGGIFRGFAVEDSQGIIATAQESLEVSLHANALSITEVVELVKCTPENFLQHRFYEKLANLARTK